MAVLERFWWNFFKVNTIKVATDCLTLDQKKKKTLFHQNLNIISLSRTLLENLVSATYPDMPRVLYCYLFVPQHYFMNPHYLYFFGSVVTSDFQALKFLWIRTITFLLLLQWIIHDFTILSCKGNHSFFTSLPFSQVRLLNFWLAMV